MSKRVANTTARTARNGRVRIGWRKRRMLEMYEQQKDQLSLGKLDEAATEAFNAFKQQIRKMLPKRFLRRAQGR
jgi:hypothetical protein